MWKCKCDCGNITIAPSPGLKRGTYKSCGCFRRDISSANFKYNNPKSKPLQYDLSGAYGIGFTNNADKNNTDCNYFYFDLDDYEKIKDYQWYFNGDGYIMGWDKIAHKHIFLHRLVTGCPSRMYVDHINHVKYDNRKCNLRVVTMGQNNINKIPKFNGNTGETGVYYRRDRNKYVAHITINGKRHSLGNFANKEDAVQARKEAEEKYFGEYSYDNSTGELNET